jgi:dynein heavy chain
MANYVAILKKGMDMTPGGKDESAVPPAERLGQEVDLERRVELLVETTCYVLFNYVAQVWAMLWLYVLDCSHLHSRAASCA